MIERVAFFLCGTITILVGRVYSTLPKGVAPHQISWSPFAISLIAMGLLAVSLSLMPRAWLTRSAADTRKRVSFRLKFLLGFAAVGVLLVIALGLIPPGSSIPAAALVYSVCPACVLTITVDPSWTTVLVALAPLNALVFGAFGGVLGTALSFIRIN